MSRTRRDDVEARKARGPAAIVKHVERLKADSKCNQCGRACRATKLEGGLCPICRGVKNG